jgi:zinc protease
VTASDVRAEPRAGRIDDQVETWTMYLSWQTVPLGHADEPALDLLSWILSGGRGTRLDDALYYDSSLATDDQAYHWSSEIDGQLVITATASSARLGKIDKVASKQVALLAKKPPTADELVRARQQVKSWMLDAMEDPVERSDLIATCWARHGKPDCLQEEWARYEAVTPDDISRVARTYLVPARRVTLSTVPEGQEGWLPGAEPVVLP